MIFPYYRLAMLAVAALAVTGTWLLLNKTSFGRVVKAGVRTRTWSRSWGSRWPRS